MGLCKCRTVTSLFCFEHRKNMCERCILLEHPTCVIKSYLQWLQDSEYTNNCGICQKALVNSTNHQHQHQEEQQQQQNNHYNNSTGIPTPPSSASTSISNGCSNGSIKLVRLACMDLFHLSCLTSLGTEIYKLKCPNCEANIIPPSTLHTPITQVLRATLVDSEWRDILLESNVIDNMMGYFISLSVGICAKPKDCSTFTTANIAITTISESFFWTKDDCYRNGK